MERGVDNFGKTLIAGLIAVLALGSCTHDVLRTLCATNADGPAGFVYDADSGACLCGSDAACTSGERCNRAGRCQARVGCESSLDCPAGTFCDRTSGECLEDEVCTEDIHCPLGEVCDALRYRCVPGCRETGDCPLGGVCRCTNGSDAGCRIGRCEAFSCDDDSFCRYGERCVPGEDPSGPKRCVKDERGPFCGGCELDPGSFTRCPGAEEDANFCLLDRKVSFYRTYCGVDCSQGQACPWGFECRNILILTSALCTEDADCPARGPACASDADCPAGRCDAATGRCGGKCSYNEDSKRGYCTCSSDGECPRDTCDPGSRRCRITRKPCSIDGDECSRAIYCVNMGDRAACLIGKNCAPGEGITCEDVRESSRP